MLTMLFFKTCQSLMFSQHVYLQIAFVCKFMIAFVTFEIFLWTMFAGHVTTETNFSWCSFTTNSTPEWILLFVDDINMDGKVAATRKRHSTFFTFMRQILSKTKCKRWTSQLNDCPTTETNLILVAVTKYNSFVKQFGVAIF